MAEFTEALQRCKLFQGIDAGELKALLGCLGGREAVFDRGEVIFAAQSRAEAVGVVLSGAVRVVREDYDGNRAIMAQLAPGELFGETFACAGVSRLPVTVEGAAQGTALVLRLSWIMEPCSSACAFHSRMVMNLLRELAAKNLQLNRKLEITSRRTTREKLLTFLHYQARQAGSHTFTIPFDRQGLADYLCVERSALSAEIGKLRREGVLESEKSSFTLLKGEIS